MSNPQLTLSGIQESVWGAVTTSIGLAVMEPSSNKPYRPEQWKNKDELMYFISLVDSAGITHKYFFDGVLKAEHTSSRKLTDHPVQTGANITDHSYRMASTVGMEIKESDVMDEFSDIPEYKWTDFGADKSVNAYRTLLSIQNSGLPLKLVTRLRNYENMVIESIIAKEDKTTRYGGAFTVVFREIIVVQGSISKLNSKEDMVTGRNILGPESSQSMKTDNNGTFPYLFGGNTVYNMSMGK